MKLDGRALWRDQDSYEEARTATVWNGRKPDRYPDVIVQAASEKDVVAAVRYAIDHDLKVKARGGGHVWTGSALRSGMMIDFSRLKQVSYDLASARVRVQPGVNPLHSYLPKDGPEQQSAGPRGEPAQFIFQRADLTGKI